LPIPNGSRAPIYASRLFSRRRIDIRVQLIAPHPTGQQTIVHARTYDVSQSGAGLTVTRQLPLGTGVVICLRLPGSGNPLRLQATVIRRRGFRVGLRFVHPTAEQRLLLSELCRA